jgi:uncharacterized protein YjbJ (UPF0337 family)
MRGRQSGRTMWLFVRGLCSDGTEDQKEAVMPDKNIDTAIGRVKEAIGTLTGNKRLKDEGRVDQAKGSVKDAVDKVADALTDSTKNGKQE